MSYIGKWCIHSVGIMNDADELVYLDPEEYLKAPMPYVDETDADAVADELRERRSLIGSKIAVVEDGTLYMLMPFPEGVSQKEIDKAVKAGEISLYDGMMTEAPKKWQERDGELWLEVGEGMSEDGWTKLSDGSGYLEFMTFRYVKEA